MTYAKQNLLMQCILQVILPLQNNVLLLLLLVLRFFDSSSSSSWSSSSLANKFITFELNILIKGLILARFEHIPACVVLSYRNSGHHRHTKYNVTIKFSSPMLFSDLEVVIAT